MSSYHIRNEQTGNLYISYGSKAFAQGDKYGGLLFTPKKQYGKSSTEDTFFYKVLHTSFVHSPIILLNFAISASRKTIFR
ncbi:hypothetical protein HMPREF1981_02906 [Bacteroides pyogenes F0041]|uniref:Uncharacterized protein n=1 Tax=Bacteroides pyogenes F0041 TaxID=1321819 RepID=U2CB30_9BACE|nr:hypothetical protein HMPREF1981_02906 [Bacteroides pyogenes F0041]SUV31932.1 Uncharacterised protein [Bacteroides pyogenes]